MRRLDSLKPDIVHDDQQISQQQPNQQVTIPMNVEPIKLGQLYDGELEGYSKNQEWHYYSLDLIDQKSQLLSFYSNTTDLVVQLNQRGAKFTDSSLFISLNDKLPSLMEFSMRCSFFGEDFCVINGQELAKVRREQNVSSIVIGVYCREYCLYEMQAELTEELFFETGKSHKLYFQANQERIFRFSIPNDPNITTIEVWGLNQNKFDKWNMIIALGNQLPNSDNALYLRPAWENGYVGKFTEDCFCFCKGCNYTVLVSVEKEGYITLGSKVHGQVVDITSSDGVMYDSVLNFHTQCYQYQVTDGDKDLRIKVESYSGDPDIYVNPNELPQMIGMSTFNSRDHFQNEELILSPEERKAKNASTGVYYICVFGQQASTYKLTVKNTDHDIYLHTGLSESGYVLTNHTNTYYFRDPILADPEVKLDLQLHVMVGKARLRGKVCAIEVEEEFEDFKDKCFFTLEELLKEDDPNEQQAVHIGSETEEIDHTICKLDDSNSKTRKGKVTCVYVIGIIGLADFETHYSVLAKTNKKEQYIALKEGVPVQQEMIEATPTYFSFKVEDPHTTKVTVQLTTIHGDPDIFSSRKSKTPSYWDFEVRSIRCGMYPEIVQYVRNLDDPNLKSLEGDYYVNVFGYTTSTFSLVYFIETETPQGENSTQVEVKRSTIKLMTGMRQKGVLKTTNDELLYEFTLSNIYKEFEVRLHSENGNFIMFLSKDKIPTPEDYQYAGQEHDPIYFVPANMSDGEDMNKLAKSKYYVLVKPFQYSVKEDNQTRDSAGMAFVFTIGFYEEDSFIRLALASPLKGQVNNNLFHYFVVDIGKVVEDDFEITLTTISGRPDIVVSFDPTNKFPDRDRNNYISESDFASDSILIAREQLTALETKLGKRVYEIYIGVYVAENIPASNSSEVSQQLQSATYTLLVNQLKGFNPVLLQNGQAQSGSLRQSEEKHYFFKTGSDMPIFATLVPKSGNPDLEVRVIKNFTESRFEWKKYLSNPAQFESKRQFGADVIFLNPNDPAFKQRCGASCILLFSVVNTNSSSNQSQNTYFTLQATRDILELSENVQIQDVVTDTQHYRYYRFYKSCASCNLEITVLPMQASSVIQVLADFNTLSQLPTHNSEGKWKIKDIAQSTGTQTFSSPLIIEPVDSSENGGRGYYTIGVHSHTNATFRLTVSQVEPPSKDPKENQTEQVRWRKAHLGQPLDFALEPEEAKYYYFENWNNATLNFQFLQFQRDKNTFHSSNIFDKRSNSKEISVFDKFDILLEVTSLANVKRLPSSPLDLKNKTSGWKSNLLIERLFSQISPYSERLVIDRFPEKVEFGQFEPCTQCYYVIKVQNTNMKLKQTASLLITQESETKALGFQSSLVIGRPYILKLSKGQTATFDFMFAEGSEVSLDVQYFTGKAKYKIYDWSKAYITYPFEGDFMDNELIQATETLSTLTLKLKQLLSDRVYVLEIEAESDLHSSLLMSQDSDLSLLTDGLPTLVLFQANELSRESRLFTYLPPSKKFHLSVSAVAGNFDSQFSLSIKKISTKPDSSRRRRNLESQSKDIGTGSLSQASTGKDIFGSILSKGPQKNLKPENEMNTDLEAESHYWQKYMKLTVPDFDIILSSIDTSVGAQRYENVPIELEDEDMLLLVRLDVMKQPYQRASVKLTLASSEIQTLLVGSTIRGHVSNWNQTMKVYELYINQNQLFTDDKTDVYVQVSPCSGKVDVFVSDNYFTLFPAEQSSQNFLPPLPGDDASGSGAAIPETSEKFGQLTARLKDVAGKEVVFVGIKSSNEFFSDLKNQVDSYFELKTRLVRGKQRDVNEAYAFANQNKQIHIQYDTQGEDSEYAILSWSPVLVKQDHGSESQLIGGTRYAKAENIAFSLWAGFTSNSREYLSSICAMELAQKNDITPVITSEEDWSKTQLRLRKADLERIKYFGLWAVVKDPLAKQPTTDGTVFESLEYTMLAYEPLQVQPDQFGVILNTRDLIILAAGTLPLFILLIMIVCKLRKKGLRLKRRLEFEVHHVQQLENSNNFSSAWGEEETVNSSRR